MKITPSAALISAISGLNEAKINQSVQDALRAAREAGQRDPRPRTSTFGELQTLETNGGLTVNPPVVTAKPADNGGRQQVDNRFRREAIDPERRARLPALGKIVDILV